MREWVHGPFGLDAAQGQPVRCQRTVLAVVHTVEASAFVAGALGVMCMTLSVIVVRRR
jgi:hypothetical protein